MKQKKYNMDFFGIGAAMKGMVHTYIQSSRCTGRTLSLVQYLKSGDRVVFTNQKEAERVKRLFREAGKDVECITAVRPEEVINRGPSYGRTVFDHSWVENFYLESIEGAQRELAHFEERLSGSGNDELITDRARKEFMKYEF